MSRYDLLNAIGDVDENSIKEAKCNTAKDDKASAKPSIKGLASLAACFTLIFIAATFVLFQMQGGGSSSNMSPEQVSTDGSDGIPNGNLTYFKAGSKTNTTVNGTPLKHSGSLSSFSASSSSPLAFRFDMGYIAVVARAIEELPDIYQTLNEYGSIYTYRYRVFKLEVIDSLESGLDGTFYYALPEYLKGDLTKYDALLISMKQRGNGFIMLNSEASRLTSFDTMFCDPYDQPQLGSIIAFTDNIFDESLWMDESWIYGYQFAKLQLEKGEGYDEMLVYRGSTLEDALNMRQTVKEGWGIWDKTATVNKYDFKTDGAKEVISFVKPFDNGVFVPVNNFSGLKYHRYIGGCPTNEWIMIEDLNTESVIRSEYRFEDRDFEDLPDIAAYIGSLDLTALTPRHTDTKGKRLLTSSAVGWYEKTENDVYSIVKLSWRYCNEDNSLEQCYDETFILLEKEGARVVSRDELITLIGNNNNIYSGKYGVTELIPQ